MSNIDALLAPLKGADHRDLNGVQLDVVRAGNSRVKRVVYQTGFRWSTHMKPTTGTDLCMHAVSGWDLVFHYHLHEAGLPFFVITALSPREAGGVDALADRFFQKPLNLETLLTAVRERLAASGSALPQP